MAIIKLSENNMEDNDPKIHQPEYIILDKEEEQPQNQQSKEQADYLATLQKIGQLQFGFGLRFLCLIAGLVAAVATVIVGALALIVFGIGLITLFMSKEINEQVVKALRNVRKLLVITFGLFLAVLSPALGLGMIILYFMLKGEALQQDIVNRVIR